MLLAVVAVLLATGCGTAVLDSNQVGDLIKDQIEKQTGATVASVQCPSDIEAKEGGAFQCTATAMDGSTATIDVTQTSDNGNLTIEAPLLHAKEAEQAVEASIGGGTKVDCPDLIPVKAAAVVACEATAGGDNATVELTFKDDQGNFEYEVKQ